MLLVSTSEGAAPERGHFVTARDLATLTDIDGLSVSPDGNWAAFQTRRANVETNTYDTAWYVVPTTGGPAHRIADGGEALRTMSSAAPRREHGFIYTPPPQWSPDSRWIFFPRQDRGRTQLWRANIDGSRQEQLTHTHSEIGPRGGVAPGFRLSGDGSRLFFETRISQAEIDSAVDAEGRDGFLFDERFVPLLASVRPRATLGTALYSGPGLSPTGLSIYDLRTRSERKATESEAADYAALAPSAPRPPEAQNIRGRAVVSSNGSFAWTEARDPTLQGVRPPKTIVAQPDGARAPIVCTHAACTSQFVKVWMWRNDEEVLFNAYTDDSLSERALYAWRPKEEGAPRIILRTRGTYDNGLWNCALAHDRLICFYEALNYPRSLVSINLSTGAVDTLYDPNPDWGRFDLGHEPQVIDVRLPTGAHLPSYLVLPPDYQPGQRLPLVIVTYVCNGFLRGGDGDEYPIFPLAAQGFAVLCHNHLSSDWAFEARASTHEAVSEQFAPGEPFQRRIQQGLDTAVTELANRGVITPDRVGLSGLSMGAMTVQYALFNMPRLTAAIASGAPSISTGYMMGTASDRRAARQQWRIESQFDPRLDTLLLERNAERVSAPFLINAADEELLQHVATFNALEDQGRAAEMRVYPNEFHIKWQPTHRLSIYTRNIEWMNFWLQGREDSDPANADQYKRWRAMRVKQCELFGPGGSEYRADAVPWYCRS